MTRNGKIRGVRKLSMMAEGLYRNYTFGEELTTHQAIDCHKNLYRNFVPDTRSTPFLLRRLGFRLVKKGIWKPIISESEYNENRLFYADEANGTKGGKRNG